MISIEMKDAWKLRGVWLERQYLRNTDAETVLLLAELARLEQRPQAQIAGMALKFFVSLPKEARDALRQIEALGSPDDLEEIKLEIARTLLHVQYKVARRQMMEHAHVENLNQLETEDDILSAAVNLTR